MREIQFNKPLLSGYFFSIIIFFFLTKTLEPVKDFIAQIQLWTFDFVNTADTQNATADIQNWLPWLALFFACFVTIFAIKNLVVMPLGIYVPDSPVSALEILLLILFVFGSMVYFVNNIFLTQPMPSVTPDVVVKMLGGISESVDRSDADSWGFVPWIWSLGPLLYIRILHLKAVAAVKAAENA